MKKRSNKKLWGGRFQEPASKVLEKMGESISYDQKLYKVDIAASVSHAKMLQKIGVINQKELKQITKGLNTILKEIESGTFVYSFEKEDIHMHIESRLTELIGEAGKKLHTARSRNDQVSQDVRLYILSELGSIRKKLIELLEALTKRAEESIHILIPGYTHLQIAQPIRASHYLLSYFWMFERDLKLLDFASETNDCLVLGSGALSGVNFPTDREFLRKDLGLKTISPNSMDAVGSRDHILQTLFFASSLLLHYSRFSEDMILYCSTEFSYVSLPDSLTTGSSIMPQKKNPDISELTRGKSARVFGNLFHLLGLLKGTPMSYNRDFQEDKVALFDSLETVKITTEGLIQTVRGLKWNQSKTEESLQKGFATATDLADFLVSKKNMSFRQAHEIVGEIVGFCAQQGHTLETIPRKERIKFSALLENDSEYNEAISLALSANKKDVFGGTNLNRQKEQISLAKKAIQQIQSNQRNSNP